MLGLYEYIALKTEQRAEALWRDGEFITNVKVGAESFSLYTIYMYYVEVTMVNDVISDITPFKQGQRLDKYMGGIIIADLEL